ncbi:MAG TPA: DNA polymerase III subunit gamma/tau [Patescibacteria group bacterium]|nr:DNA polymerase III subunit gamma/tau [Patescibacteria group bacterium]
MVFYRKYRPQTIDELDSTSVRETLTSVLAKNIPHAFFFTGPKGLGKTSAARIVAKVVNCENSNKRQGTGNKKESKKHVASGMSPVTSIEPCNICDQCVSITNGTNLDVLEIDAASNRGIDEIRDLKEKIRLAPLKAKKKVYIIDEVHMLTTESFNALLKTLEEPPEHAMFMLCTTEPHKVPQTIHSRCYHVAFQRATEEELLRSFSRIVEKEKIQIDKKALQAIAKLADGGFRDGTKILEELVAIASSQPITTAMIDEKYRMVSVEGFIDEMIEVFAKNETKKGMKIIDTLVQQNIDIKYFLTELLQKLHEELLIKITQDTKKSQTSLSIVDLRLLLDLLAKAYEDMKYAVLPQLPLELALLDFAEADVDADTVTVAKEEVSLGNGAYTAKAAEKTVTTLRKEVGNIAKVNALYGEAEKPMEKKNDAPLHTPPVSLLHYSQNGEITKEWMDGFWKTLIVEIKSYNHTIAGVLRGCMIKSYDRKNLIIETAYTFHKEKLDDTNTKDALERLCTTLVGNPIQISVVLKSA